MADYDGNPYNDNNTTNVFEVPSTFDFPDMRQADPLGGFQDVPDAPINGYGTGAEQVHPDGTASTRYKNPSNVQLGGGFDGGTP